MENGYIRGIVDDMDDPFYDVGGYVVYHGVGGVMPGKGGYMVKRGINKFIELLHTTM